MSISSRNQPGGIETRTLQNLKHIRTILDSWGGKGPDPEVYVVTQLMNSLLGLVVRPLEKCPKRFDQPELKELYKTFICPSAKGGRKDWERLRNAIAHCDDEFDSDKRRLEEVTIKLKDSRTSKTTGSIQPHSVEIKADCLYEFCVQLAHCLIEKQGQDGP